MNYLENEFSYNNITKYAQACIDLATHISVLGSENYKNLLMPSRGVYPFLFHANQAKLMEEKLSNNNLSFEERIENARENLKFRFTDSPFFKSKIWIPYTADTGNKSEDGYTLQIRESWTKLLKCMLDEDFNNPIYKLYKYIIEKEAKKDFDAFYKAKIVKDSGLIYLDTVISGRAAYEIIKSFSNQGITNFHALLIVDKDGNKLRGEYKNFLDKLVANGKATLIKVPRIFTEDRGPSLTGITGIIYPTIMNEITNKVDELKDSSIIGAGLWNLEISAREDQSNMNFTISNAKISTLIHARMSDIIYEHQNNKMFELQQQSLIKHLSQNNMFDKNTTLHMMKPFLSETIVGSSKIDISSSHVIRIEHDTTNIKRIIDDFKNNHL